MSSDEATPANMLGGIPTAAAIGSLGVLWLAVVHELAYFGVVAPQFISLMSATDYVASAISWLPSMGFFLVAGFLLSLFMRRAEGFRSDEELSRQVRSTWAAWWHVKGPIVFLTWSVLLFGALSLVFLDIYTSGILISFFLAIVWFKVVEWFFDRDGPLTVSPVFVIVTQGFPALLILVYFHGLVDGYKDLNRFQRTHVFKMKNDDVERNAILLRSLAVGLIVRDAPRGRVTLLKWDDVSAISFRSEAVDTRSLFCRIAGRGCFGVPEVLQP